VETLSSFWAGAVRLAGRATLGEEGSRLTLEALAGRAGGWPALARAEGEALAAWGARWDVIHTLRSTPPLPTRGRAITRACPGYPRRLSDLPDPPPVLFTEGDPTVLERPGVAIVGTRHLTAYGASVAHRIAWACARAGLVVWSGLARGIDTHAHLGALSARGRTGAVLGHGLGHTAPPSNRRLRERLVAEGGLLLSAWPDEVPPTKHTFPERNQWIAALSTRVVVVEAPERSGALHTARALTDTSRDDHLHVVPGPLGAETWKGSTGLLLAGARPLVDLDAFVADLVGETGGARHPDWLSALFSGADLPEVAHLRGGSTVELLQELSRLELGGRLVRLPGGRYAPGGA
jgi:DNA processing protein